MGFLRVLFLAAVRAGLHIKVRAFSTAVGIVLGSALFAGCSDDSPPRPQLFLGASTTVTDRGLVDELIVAFEEAYGYEVRHFRQSSGHVLELARNGELDVVMTHSPEDEQFLVEAGYASERTQYMRSFFQLVGPAEDPAGVAGAENMAAAFARVAASGARFVSRGDDSGTHNRELAYWAEAGIEPRGEPWYSDSDSGQREVLTLASDEGAYTLSDSPTFITLQGLLDLAPLFRDDVQPNFYAVLRLNPERLEEVNREAADAWIAFVTSDRGKRVIAEYGRDEFGQSLFDPLLLN
jgi:tungstate transport system substrate-binding protein